MFSTFCRNPDLSDDKWTCSLVSFGHTTAHDHTTIFKMPVRSRSPDGVGHDAPWSRWTNDPSQGRGKWEPTAQHPSWFKYGRNRDARTSLDFNKRPGIDDPVITPQDNDLISKGITDHEDQEAYVHRSYRLTNESAVFTQLGHNEELIVYRYAEITRNGQSWVGGRESEATKWSGHWRSAFTTQDIEAAQDGAVDALSVEQQTRKPTSPIRRIMSKPVIRPLRSDPLPVEDLTALLDPPHLPRVPVTTEGSQLGLQTLDFQPPEHVMTFRSYASAKISGLNPSNCDADLLAKFYDAVQHTEHRLQREGRIDDNGYPRTQAGGRRPTFSDGFQVMQIWFHEAILSVDRVVGLHVAANGRSDGKFIEAPPTVAQKGDKEDLMLKTFRLGPYRVMERRPELVEADGTSKDSTSSVATSACKE